MMRHYRIAMGLVCSSLGLSVALPAAAQQVVLTPGGTMIQPMPQAPVATPSILDLMMRGEQRETTYYDAEIAPGTGIDPKPGDFNAINPGRVVDTGAEPIILEIDPDALIGGPGGMRYADLYPELPTNNKPDPVSPLTPGEVAEAYRRGEIAYPNGFSATNQAAGNSLSSQLNSTSAPESIVSTISNVSSSITSPKLLNPPLLPSLSNASASPLSTSRILPGFNQ
jgi:hypothetical protein